MSQPAILVENLGKRYSLRRPEATAPTFREAAAGWASDPLGRIHAWFSDAAASSFWALRHLSFSVPAGEVLAVIGRNGAGKSTLLKLLSRITAPTEGRAVIRGRVASLLEVGTGFHHELTGRENIFLNGSILGMKRSEISRQLGAIIAFAGVEDFLDTPIKRYSSGMKMRLAFAVAAHLEPEILIIDEVLAVGDHEFQQRCLGKMRAVAASGRTVLFVSHHIPAIQALCTRALLLENGQLYCQGLPDEVLETYLRTLRPPTESTIELTGRPRMKSDSKPLMQIGRLLDDEGNAVSSVAAGAPLTIEVTFHSEGHRFKPVLGAVFKTALGTALFGTDNRIQAEYLPKSTLSCGSIRMRFDSLPLCPGEYSIDLYLGDETRSLDAIESALRLEITPSDYLGSGKLPSPACGPLLVRASWSTDGGALETAN